MTFSHDLVATLSQELVTYRASDKLSQVLDGYEKLLREYSRLQIDYDEARDARDRYKEQTLSQSQCPFVLVIVDGDGYVFDDEFVSAGDIGGSNAARQLHDAVNSSLKKKGLEECEVMVRVFANITGLSKTAAKSKLCGPEKGALAPFVAGFNRSYGLADIVDSGEVKESADFKLRATLKLYAKNSQCKHIYFAACHDVGYAADLTAYKGNRNKFTLIESGSARFLDEFKNLDMNIERLTGVFRTAPLDACSEPKQKRNTTMNTKEQVAYKHSGSSSSASTTNDASQTSIYCKYGRKCKFGTKCKFGRKCKFLHLDEDSEMNPDHTKWNLDTLPRRDEILDGYIALSKLSQRLDPSVLYPWQKDFEQIPNYEK